MTNASQMTIDIPPAFPDKVAVASARFEAENRIVELCTAADMLQISDPHTQAEGTRVMGEIKTLMDRIEAQRKGLSGPFDKAAKSINACFKPILTRLALSQRNLKTAWGTYVDRVETENKAKLKVQREAEQKAARDAAAAGVAITVKPKPAPEPVARSVVTETGQSGLKKVWDFEIENPVDVPEQFKVIDTPTVRAYIRTQVKAYGKPAPVAGLRFFQKTDVAVKGA